MNTIKKRLTFALFITVAITGASLLVIPAGPYWILTGKDLITKYLDWIDKKDKDWEV